jgi:hypothetical protein
MERKRRINVPGRGEVDATEVGFRAGAEHWNEYLADDGSVIRLKLVATEILRIDDTYDADGNPSYVVKSTNVVSVSAPDNLRRGAAPG